MMASSYMSFVYDHSQYFINLNSESILHLILDESSFLSIFYKSVLSCPSDAHIPEIFTLVIATLESLLTPTQKDQFVIRSMDCFARLMILQRDNSVCTAITSYENTLYIAANNSGASKSW